MKKKSIIIIICSVLIAFSLLFCAVGGLSAYGLYAYTDAFDFLKAEMPVSYEEAASYHQRVLENFDTGDENDIERAEVLCNAILENESITNKEKKHLAKYIQYFIDNKYIDAERVAQKLSSFTITPNDPSLTELGIGAEYKSENTITFATDEDRKYALSHELHHCMENENLSYELYGWFGEGFACLVNYEYFDMIDESYNLQTFFVRGLCEIIGPDVLFEVSATGNMDLAVNALTEAGVSEDKVKKAFDLFLELKDIDSALEEITPEQRFEAVNILLDMYSEANDGTDEFPVSLYGATEDFFCVSAHTLDYYYLNSAKEKGFGISTGFVTQEDFDELYYAVAAL